MSDGTIILSSDNGQHSDASAFQQILNKLDNSFTSTQSARDMLSDLKREVGMIMVKVDSMSEQVRSVGDIKERVTIIETRMTENKNQLEVSLKVVTLAITIIMGVVAGIATHIWH